MSRKFESADPLRRSARRPTAAALREAAKRRQQTAPAAAASPQASSNDTATLTQKQPPPSMQSSGFQEFPLKMCSKEDVALARYHILKFHSKTAVDPANQFVPPLRLHRKDPRQLQLLAGQEDEEEEGEGTMDVDTKPNIKSEDSNDANNNSNANAGSSNNGNGGSSSSTGQSSGTANNAGGAGGAGGAAPDKPKKKPFYRRRKTRQIHGGDKNDAARKLRYEEHYPWVMEDFDNKNTWISSFEAAQSDNHAVLTYDASSNGFKVIPIEKFYKMTPSARYATLSLEDAEERMESAHTMRDRWLMSHLQPRNATPQPGTDHLQGTGPGFGGYGNSSSSRLRTVVGSEERQHKYNMDEEMDYDNQEMFDDDEGAPILDGPEEDVKEVEDRMKREQLKANELMDAGDNEDVDDLFDDEQTREGKQGRKLRKALRSLEKNQYYDTDEEENPYASSVDESDSDEELDAQTNNFSVNELGVPIKREEGDDASAAAQMEEHEGMMLPVVPQFRKKHINRDSLPRGTIVLQLPPEMLDKFQHGEWNPDAKRETSAGTEEDERLLTREDVRSNIKSGETDIKQLLNALRPKLSQHNDNVNRLRQFVKEVARSKDRKLYLRN